MLLFTRLYLPNMIRSLITCIYYSSKGTSHDVMYTHQAGADVAGLIGARKPLSVAIDTMV